MNNLPAWLKLNKVLVLVLLGVLAAGLFYSFHFQIRPVVDARAYDVIATNLASGHGYREDLDKSLAQDFAIVRVGPLYEYFLAGLYKVFGHYYQIVWVAQALLHAASAWLIYLVSLLIFSAQANRKKIALWAAIFFGFYPDLIEISAMLLTETLYLFLMCLALYVFFLYFRKQTVWLTVISGVVFGLAALARPPVLLFIPIVLFYLYKKRLRQKAVLFLFVLLAVFLPWTARNYQLYHKFMPFGAAGAFNFWIGNYHGGSGEQEATAAQYDFLASHPVSDINNESLRQFKNFLVSYPAEFVKLTLLRADKYFSVLRPSGFWFYQTGLGQFLFVACSALASMILFVLGAGGFIKAFRSKNEPLLYLLAFTVATPLVIIVSVVETRYRFQVYPFLAVLGGFFIVWLKSRAGWWKEKVLWLAILLVFSNAFIDFTLSLVKIRERLNNFF